MKHLWLISFIFVMSAGTSLAETDKDPIGHARLLSAYGYAKNAELLAKGLTALPHKAQTEAAKSLNDAQRRKEIGIMVDAVRFKYNSIRVQAAQDHIGANIVMVWSRLTTNNPKFTFTKALTQARKRGDLTAPEFQRYADAIHSALRAP